MNEKMTPAQEKALRQQLFNMRIAASCKLFDGTKIGTVMHRGAHDWSINDVPVSLEEAQQRMQDDPADAWEFVAENAPTDVAPSFIVRRPTDAEKMEQAKLIELAAWNRAVDRKKAEKKARKEAEKSGRLVPAKDRVDVEVHNLNFTIPDGVEFKQKFDDVPGDANGYTLGEGLMIVAPNGVDEQAKV